MNKRSLTLPYTLMQGAYCMLYCALFNYAAVYLYHQGLSSKAVGVAVAVMNLLAVAAQLGLANLADRSLRVTVKGLTLCLCGIGFGVTLPLMFGLQGAVFAVVLFSVAAVCMCTMQPFVSALGMDAIESGRRLNFGVARGLGSGFFALISTVFGVVTARYGAGVLPIFTVFLFVMLGVLVAFFPEKPDGPVEKEASGKGFFYRYPKFLIFIVGQVLGFICIQMMSTYLIDMVVRLGGNSADMGRVFSVQALVEIPVMMGFAYLVNRWGNRKLFLFSILMMPLKALVLWLAPSIGVLFAAQVFQMLSYGIFIPASIFYVNRRMADGDRVRGQAALTVAMNLGAVFGSLLGGFLVESFHVTTAFMAGFVLSGLGSVVMYLSVEQVDES